MLSDEDRTTVFETFGADDEQVRRDHLISYVLAALSSEMADEVRFFGGTALARTFLPAGRLSEDVDLIAAGRRSDVAGRLIDVLDRRLSREFGRFEASADLATSEPAAPVSLSFASGLRVQLQLLPEDHYPSWPFAPLSLVQRYADAGPAVLRVPTREAFVAWKTATFLDRRSSRDLWDLAALADAGAFTPEAAELFQQFGPSLRLPTDLTFPPAPREAAWIEDLSHQTRLRRTAAEARSSVVHAWNALA